MAIPTKTSPKIWPGRAKVMQKAPPVTRPSPRITRREAPKEEVKEIAYLAMAKEVKEVKKRKGGPPRPPKYGDILATAQAKVKQGADINDVVTYIQESGLTGKGEAGYVLNSLTIQAEKLTGKLRTWYDQQIDEMDRVLAQARADAKQRIALLKGRGDYTASDIQRIYTSEYPKWSGQYKSAQKRLGKIVAKGGREAVATEQAGPFAGVRAKTAGVDIGDLTDKQIAQLKTASLETAIERSKKLGLSTKQLMAIRAVPGREKEAFEQAYQVATGAMVPFVDPETKETLLIQKDAAELLKATSAYAAARGTAEQRLGIALVASRREFDTWLGQLKDKFPELHKVYESQGYEALTQAIKKQTEGQQAIISKLDKYKQDKGYDVVAALIDKAITPDELKAMGFKGSDIDEATKWLKAQTEYLNLPKTDQANTTRMARGKLGIYAEPYEKMTTEEKLQVLGYYQERGVPTAQELQKKYAIQYSLEPMLAITPVAGTVYFWDKMPTYGKVLSVVGDVVCIGFVVNAAAAGARAAKGYTAAARTKAALRGAGEMVLAEITAPGELIAHPVAVTKGVGKQLLSALETIFHPKKLPLGGTELTYTTGRLPVKDVGGATKAMQLRDAAVKAAIQGKKATATMGDITLTLNPSELQKVGGAMAIHATPDIRPYINGATIGKKGTDIFISPQFHSRFAQSTSMGIVPEGGVKGGLIIRDPDVLQAVVPSGKVYMGTAEIEAKLKAGITLSAPSQVLFTRDIAGNRLTFLVIGKPFTASQVAKLKFLGSLDTVAQIFKPTMELTGAQKTAISAMDDLISLSQQRATLAAQLETARAAGRATVNVAGRVMTVQEVGQRIAKLDSQVSNLIRRINAPREAISPTDVVWGQYADRGILERWEELNPGKATRTDRGTRLPDIPAAQTIRRASLAERRKAPLITRKVPVGERRVPLKPYRVPPTSRLYTPARVPPYAPTRVPQKAPPYAPLAYVPPRIPRITPGKAPISLRHPRVKFMPTKLKQERIPGPERSLISWRQGMYYVTVVEPFRTTGGKPDVIYSRHKPPWGKVARGRRSPQRTLKSIGKVPGMVGLGMGVVTARVKRGKVLRFHR